MHYGDGNEDRSNNGSHAKQAHLCRNGFHQVCWAKLHHDPNRTVPSPPQGLASKAGLADATKLAEGKQDAQGCATQLVNHSLKQENTFQREGQLKYRGVGDQAYKN